MEKGNLNVHAVLTCQDEPMITRFDYRVLLPLKWVIDEVYNTVYTYMQFRAAKSL